ncbi:hypothetical protein M707_23675 [Arthrobacter sp. AK-YN10]|nr:hypothetical protein M707_23675 [Arthrobacter sp. AK-YN10]
MARTTKPASLRRDVCGLPRSPAPGPTVHFSELASHRRRLNHPEQMIHVSRETYVCRVVAKDSQCALTAVRPHLEPPMTVKMSKTGRTRLLRESTHGSRTCLSSIVG